MNHFWRLAMVRTLLGVCLLAIFSSLHMSVQAQETTMPKGFLPERDGAVARSELDAAEASSVDSSATSQAEAFFYKWYPGSTFHPRSSSTGYTYEANGCISATSNAPFTTDLQVPDGARLIGVRFYFYDTVAASSLLFASNYDGLGDVDDLASAASTGTGGYGSAYLSITPNYTVDTYNRSLALNWYPIVTGSTMRLCGARAFYSLGGTAQQMRAPDSNPDSMQAPQAEGYLFIAGSSFIPRSSATAYEYVNDTGCIYSTTSGLFTADIDLPDRYQIIGHRMYYFDTGTGSVTTLLTDYDGEGDVNERVTIQSVNATGYTTSYANVATPYYVDRFIAPLAMVVNIDAVDSTVRFCGVRVYYTASASNPSTQANAALPRSQPSPNEPTTAAAAQSAPDQAVAATAPTLNSDGVVIAPARSSAPTSFADEMVAPNGTNGVRYAYRWIAGSNFTPRSSGHTYSYSGGGCTYTINAAEAITAPLHLPDGATIVGVRIFYVDTVATSGRLYLTTHDGAGALDDVLTIDTTGATGYGTAYAPLPATYVVDNSDLSHVLTWSTTTTGTGIQFCGARVWYTVPTISVYLPLIRK